ncbi:CaiB/BaiF CoA transferase family protein [Clostridium sp.]|uniref:CaiB/BaiF CoA transferase family protein n=1 Tax=Clostridium sp. TaxID=1506 RepID=UPI003F2A810B
MKPLRGMKVLDLTTLNGFATMTLADYGAEVVKVEMPGSGDAIRGWGPPFIDDVSVYHTFLDRGKKSITLDLRVEEGKDVFKELVKEFDVVIDNFRFGKMDDLGLGYEVLEDINPKIIMASLTAFGNKGPWRDQIAFDAIIQAKTGFMDFTGFADEPPSLIGFPIADQYSCLFMHSAVVAAYFHMLRTGEGQKVETSMWESLFAAQEDKLMYTELFNQPSTRIGNAHPEINPYDIIKCKDGYMTLGISTDPQWEAFSYEFGMDDWVKNPKYNELEARGVNYFGDLRNQIEELFDKLTCNEIDERCKKVKVPASPCKSSVEAKDDIQLKLRNMVVEVEDQRIGKIPMVGKTAKYHQDNEYDNEFDSAPLLGQHNIRYYKELLNLSEEKINQLAENNII